MVDAITLSTPELGDRSYLLHDGERAVAVDPQRDTDRLLRAAAMAGVRISFVAETHLHNDYVSGGWDLAQQLGVPYLVAAAEDVSFERRPVRDGEEIVVTPQFSLRVLATPGHTPHHVSYVALDRGLPVMACTGGSLLLGSVGRTDLLGATLAGPLAREQYRSAQRLAQLPGPVEVLPTHGFGSFCSVGVTSSERSTVVEQRMANLAFRATDEDAFVEMLLAGFGDYPRYYAHMVDHNRRGAGAPDLSPPPRLDGEQVRHLANGDAWVVDLRSRGAFASRHLHRTVSVEHDTPFTTYLGWLLPDDTPLVLMAESPKTIAGAQVDLSRIGIEGLAGQYVGPLPPATGDPAVRSYPVRTFVDLAQAVATPGHVALDVRRQEEWDAGHLPGALHVPLHELPGRMDELPPGTVWVHCAAGYRAGIATSLLSRHGRSVVLVDGRFSPPPR
jgi:hydroxyacylglutathione hydrolase